MVDFILDLHKKINKTTDAPKGKIEQYNCANSERGKTLNMNELNKRIRGKTSASACQDGIAAG